MTTRLHLVTDDRVLAGAEFLRIAGAVTEAGGREIAIHFRGPRTSGRRLADLGVELRRICEASGTAMLANDRVDLALALTLDGVQLGERSLPVERVRPILGSAALLGRSVHGAAEARRVVEVDVTPRGIDFLVAGTVFATPSHPGRKAAGLGLIREVTRAVPGVPVMGIGGISLERAASVRAAGAHGVCVIRAVWDAEAPAEAVAQLLEALEEETGGTRG